jgi:isopentenyldiphosphate isomerase
MSDLRTRIAAVLMAHPDKWDGTCCGDPNLEIEVQEDWAEHVADAVIRELGMKEERDRPYSTRHDWQGDWRHRYVTEWKADDE